MAVITQLPPDERSAEARRGGTRVVRAQQMQNEGTRIAPLEAIALHKPLATLDDEAEWSATFERLQSWRKEHIERDGLAVVVRSAGGDGRPCFDVALAAADGAPHALVVGRHARADLALPADGSGSLRHAAVVLWPSDPARVGGGDGGGDDAGPRAVAIDLKSHGGLRTRDGRSARRLSSTTALHFGAGDADVFALVARRDEPFAVRFPDELDAHVSGALVDDVAPSPAVVPADAWEKSRVFRTGDTRALRGVAHGLVVRATPAEVAGGIVLGRYERCHRTDALAARDEVSRVHALVFAVERHGLWIVDTSSTAGTVLVDDKTGARAVLGEGHRIAPLTATTRVLLAGVDVQIDVQIDMQIDMQIDVRGPSARPR